MNKEEIIKMLLQLADPEHPGYPIFEGDNDFKLRVLCLGMVELLKQSDNVTV